VAVEVFNSGEAEKRVRDGEADIGMLSWLGADAEPGGVWTTPWTRDGIAIVLHASTQLPGTSLGHLQEVFRGRVQEWEGQVYTVVSREAGSGTRSAFESIVMDYHPVTLNAALAPSSGAVVSLVTSTPGAIGYVSSLQLERQLPGNLRVLPVDGITPSAARVADGQYVLWRQLYLATLGEPTGEVREFALWLLGAEGQRLSQQFAATRGAGG
jgi:phosphate transport system substrate-binding protein